MFSGYIRRTAALLILIILTASASGCSLFNREQDPNQPFDAPYINNYYVNKHEPVCVSGSMTVYKFDSFDAPVITMGGHDYRGGLIIENGWSSADLGCIELPLGKKYKHISFVIGGNYALKKVSIDSDGQEIYQIDLLVKSFLCVLKKYTLPKGTYSKGQFLNFNKICYLPIGKGRGIIKILCPFYTIVKYKLDSRQYFLDCFLNQIQENKAT